MRTTTKLLTVLDGGSGGGDSYHDTAAALFDLGYWPANETSGTTADEYNGVTDRDGTYSGVVLDSVDGPVAVGGRAGQWDGVDDYLDLTSASLNAAASLAAGTVQAWLTDDDWTNATGRFPISLFGNASNRVFVKKQAANQLRIRTILGGTTTTIDHTLTTPSGWIHVMVTWSDAANDDELKVYIDGSQVETTATAIGTAAVAPTTFVIGRDSISSGTSHDGNLMAIGLTNNVLDSSNATTLAGG